MKKFRANVTTIKTAKQFFKDFAKFREKVQKKIFTSLSPMSFSALIGQGKNDRYTCWRVHSSPAGELTVLLLRRCRVAEVDAFLVDNQPIRLGRSRMRRWCWCSVRIWILRWVDHPVSFLHLHRIQVENYRETRRLCCPVLNCRLRKALLKLADPAWDVELIANSRCPGR